MILLVIYDCLIALTLIAVFSMVFNCIGYSCILSYWLFEYPISIVLKD